MELAAFLSGKATSVTVVGRSEIPFANVLGKDIGGLLKKVILSTTTYKYTRLLQFYLMCTSSSSLYPYLAVEGWESQNVQGIHDNLIVSL